MTLLPHEAFAAWYADAVVHEPDVPDAMQLATIDEHGRPALRTVLMKSHGPDGIVFYTNLQSRKGRHLTARADVSALFHWKSLERQVLVDGRVEPVTDAEADTYFASRPRGSQLGAWASLQSQPLPGRDALLGRLAEAEARYAGRPVPRPPHWSGFRLVPRRWELWQGRADRLHERTVWERDGDAWRRGLLYP